MRGRFKYDFEYIAFTVHGLWQQIAAISSFYSPSSYGKTNDLLYKIQVIINIAN